MVHVPFILADGGCTISQHSITLPSLTTGYSSELLYHPVLSDLVLPFACAEALDLRLPQTSIR